MQKAFLKAKDRRKNFENGEAVGFVYAIALSSLLVTGSGQLNHIELNIWQRAGVGLIGIVALAAKTIIKRRFWRQTEDAEYKDEEDDDYRRKRESNRDEREGEG